MHRVLLVLVLADFDTTRFEARLVKADFEALDDPRLEVLGTAAGPRLGQTVAEPFDTGQPPPFAAVPAIGAPDLAARFEPDQCRHDLDLETVRDVERGIVNALRHG